MPIKAGPYLNNGSYWGNFNAFAAVGGRREPLVPEGMSHATKDFAVAKILFERKRARYEEMVKAGVVGDPFPADFATTYLIDRRSKKLRKHRLNPNAPEAQWPQVIKNDMRDTKRILIGILGSPPMARIKRMSDITPAVLETIREHLELPHKNELGETEMYSVGTVDRHMSTFRAMLTHATKKGLLVRNPFDAIEMPSAEREICNPDDYLRRTEVRGVLQNVLPSPKNPWAIEKAYVLFYTGCRLSEMNDIRVSNVHFNEGFIYIPRGKRRDGTVRYRKVPLWPKLEAVLKESLRRNPRPADGLLFPGEGRDGKSGRMRKTLAQAFTAAGVTKPVQHHICRHSYITSRMEMTTEYRGRLVNVDLTELAREVGHADADLINTVYGHLERAYERQDELDYYDALPAFGVRAVIWKNMQSARVKAGIAARKKEREQQRDADVAVLPMG